MSLLDISNLTKRYDLPSSKEPIFAVDDVTLSIDEGEIFGIVGESGCGKTTLGRCILRLIEPTSGTVKFDGQNVVALSQRDLRLIRRHMQIVFQDPYASLDPRWRVYDILEEPLRIHTIVPPAERSAEIARILGDVGLPPESAFRYPHEFSGGQRQRIGIARALALHPKFLIADEPVSALDVSIRAQILNLLLRLQAEKGITIVFIGHDLGVVRQISRRIAVMHKGQIVEQALADQIFDDPRHPYTQALLSAIPSIKNIGGIDRTELVSPVDTAAMTGDSVGCKYRSRCSYAQKQCADEKPMLQPVENSPGQFAACHFRNELPMFKHSVLSDAV